jgi:cytochrome c-type biogenesis protein CcmH
VTGWIIIIALAVLTALGILAVNPARRRLWQPVLAALVLAFAGYSWQGNPDYKSAPANAAEAEQGAADALIKMRSDMDQSYGVAKTWLVTADGFARDGNYQAAAGYIQAGIKQHPDNADLWSALGLVLMLAADGDLTPPAKLAFDKARNLAPQQPAPDYFEGLAALFDRKPVETLVKWRALLAQATPKAKWRAPLESQVKGLESMLAQAVATQNANNIEQKQ